MKETMDRPKVGVGVIIRRTDGKILMCLRKGAHGEGTWGLPGGHLEGGETLEDCARREVLEESGLTLDAVRAAAFTNDIFTAENRHYLTVFMLAAPGPGEPSVCEPDKCLRWAWFDADALPSPLFLPIRNLLDSNPCESLSTLGILRDVAQKAA